MPGRGCLSSGVFIRVRRRRSGASSLWVLSFYPALSHLAPPSQNETIEEERWIAGTCAAVDFVINFLLLFCSHLCPTVGRLIQRNGGVLTAEQLAPLMDPVPSSDGLDESFVLPALVRFNGSPEVTREGHILYRFQDLAKTAAAKLGRPVDPTSVSPLAEREWAFSAAPPSNVLFTVGLGVANFVGVAWLTALMRSPAVTSAASAEVLRTVAALLPGLQVYAGMSRGSLSPV